MIDRFPIGDLSYGEHSIFSSAGFFYAYHIWGFVLSAVVIYGMWKEVRILFMVGFMLLGLQMFYPWFTSSPAEQKQGQDRMKSLKNQEQVDVVNSTTNKTGKRLPSMKEPPPMDQLSEDSAVKTN